MLLEVFGFLRLTWTDILDIVLVAAAIFLVLKWIRGSSAMNIFIAILLLIVIRIIASSVGLKMVSALLGTILDVGALAIIVIFQPEIRKALWKIGRSAGSTLEKRSLMEKLFSGRDASMQSDTVLQLAQACKDMAETKTGALIVIRHRANLDEVIGSGDTLDAKVVTRLVENIFFKNSPLHDGALVIGGDRIIAARCTLPITERTDIPAHYGMRHKAAVGLSEQTDADVVVVSEQTGKISFVRAGNITPIESINALKLLLMGNNGEEK